MRYITVLFQATRAMDTYLRSKQPFTVKMSHLDLILPSSSGVSSSDSGFDKVLSSVASTSEAPPSVRKAAQHPPQTNTWFSQPRKKKPHFHFFFPSLGHRPLHQLNQTGGGSSFRAETIIERWCSKQERKDRISSTVPFWTFPPPVGTLECYSMKDGDLGLAKVTWDRQHI